MCRVQLIPVLADRKPVFSVRSLLFPLTLILIFSNFAYHIIRQVLSMSIKGNPVQFGDGPAAVIPLFSMRKINPFSLVCHCFHGNGKAAERMGESEDLPEERSYIFRGL